MPIEKIRTQQFKAFKKGLLSESDAYDMSQNYSPDLRNVRIIKQHIGVRPGFRKHGDFVGVAGSGIQGMGWHETENGVNDQLWAVTDSNFYVFNSATREWDLKTNTITTDAVTNHAIWRERTYLFNGVDELGLWDGSIYTEPVTGLSAGYKYAAFFGEKMWVAGLSSAQSTVYYSRTATPSNPDYIHDFSGGNTGTELIGSGGYITGLLGVNQHLIIAKNSAIFSIATFDFNASTPTPVVQPQILNEGIPNQDAMYYYDNDVYYFSIPTLQIKRFRLTDQSTRFEGIPVSTPIDSFLEEFIDNVQPNVSIIAHNRKVFVNLRSKFSITNDIRLVWDLDKEAWLLDVAIAHKKATLFKDRLYFGSETDATVYLDEEGFADNDAATFSYYLTNKEHFGDNNNKKLFRFIDFQGYINDINELFVDVYIDDELIKTITIDINDISGVQPDALGFGELGGSPLGGTTGGVEIDKEFFRKRISLYSSGYSIQLRFRSQTIGGYWEAFPPKISFIVKSNKQFPVGSIK